MSHVEKYRHAAITEKQKLAFLSRPESYAESPSNVTVTGTHMSWVFMVNGFVYKMKKPVKYSMFDHRTLRSRLKNSKEEIRLNQTLAPGIYLGVVPLTVKQGKLQIDGAGEMVECLVKMKRIPHTCMLDYQVANASWDENKLRTAAKMLVGFYKNSTAPSTGFHQYFKKLENAILSNKEWLLNPQYELPHVLVKEISAGQLAYLYSHRKLLEERVKAGCIIETHGDLKPEHICLGSEPVIIDRLEFSKELRIMDVAEELSFLSMECEALGDARPGKIIFEEYISTTGDNVPLSLIIFFKIKKAMTRAYLVARHVEEKAYRDDPKWLNKANTYLSLAEKYHREMIT